MHEQSDYFHKTNIITPIPHRQSDFIDYLACARDLVDHGHSIIKLPVTLQEYFWETLDLYDQVEPVAKSEFSFPSDTDGFLPFGMEYAKSTNQIDLCERYCYWHKNRALHEGRAFSRSEFYRAIAGFESGISEIAQRVMDTICGLFDTSDTVDIRGSSYLQFCAYDKQLRAPDREYLQDRHEDGHLITFIKGNRDGLVIFPHGERRAVRLGDDEIIIITGSLLTLLSDKRIPYMDHAVLNPRVPVARSSLVYFVVPDLKAQYTSFIERKSLDLEATANESHEAFGNSPFTGTENGERITA